jgi:hypothetical protein
MITFQLKVESQLSLISHLKVLVEVVIKRVLVGDRPLILQPYLHNTPMAVSNSQPNISLEAIILDQS